MGITLTFEQWQANKRVQSSISPVVSVRASYDVTHVASAERRGRKRRREEAARALHTDGGNVYRQVSFLKLILIGFSQTKSIPNHLSIELFIFVSRLFKIISRSLI